MSSPVVSCDRLHSPYVVQRYQMECLPLLSEAGSGTQYVGEGVGDKCVWEREGVISVYEREGVVDKCVGEGGSG